MLRRSKNLSDLKQTVDTLVKKQGPQSPCAYWIVTREDFKTIDDNDRDVPCNVEDVKDMLDELTLHEWDYIADEIYRLIDNELSSRDL